MDSRTRDCMTQRIPNVKRVVRWAISYPIDAFTQAIRQCFVTTATKPRGQSPIRILRSYEDPSPNVWPHPWFILDAALATSAAPTYFRNHVIYHQNATYHYEDAGIHGLNNPTIAAWDECDLLCPDITPYCIISLGTGLRRHDPSENNTPASHWILDTLQNIARIVSRLRSLSKHLSNEATKVADKHEEMERLTRKLDPK
jgi:patatin-like phospholipase/acyl hydrolase